MSLVHTSIANEVLLTLIESQGATSRDPASHGRLGVSGGEDRCRDRQDKQVSARGGKDDLVLYLVFLLIVTYPPWRDVGKGFGLDSTSSGPIP